MGLFDLFRQKTNYKELMEQQRLDFLAQRQEQKLEYEKRKQDIELIIKAKEAQLKQKEIDLAMLEIDEEMNPIDEDSSEVDNLLQGFAMNLLNKRQSENGLAAITPEVVTNHPTQTPSSSGVSFSDEELKNLINAQPKYLLNIAKTLEDDKIKEFVKSKFPKIDDDSIKRGIAIIRNKSI